MEDGAPPVAVIDVGSNSVRLLIARPLPGGHLDILDDARATLRLARVVDAHGAIPPDVLEQTLDAIGDFVRLASHAGAESVRAVGTAALRDAANADALARKLRSRWGVKLEVLSGSEEVRLASLGAVFGLPVTDGLLLDLGGGSLLLARIEDRALVETWSFPFGTLRLTDRFLSSDPPAEGGMAALRRHVRRELRAAGVPRLGKGEVLVGTGGTVRNLANVSRRRQRYPISRLHGHSITIRRLHRLTRLLAGMSHTERRDVRGLNADRAGIIAAGALVVDGVAAHTHTDAVLVAGQGLREGIARSQFLHELPPVSEVRRGSVEAFAQRFGDAETDSAHHRAQLAGTLSELLDPGADAEAHETVEYAAMLYNAGLQVDFYRRAGATTAILLDSNLAGFSQPQIARIAAAARLARRPTWEVRSLRPLLGADDEPALRRAGVVVALAEELRRRSEPERVRASLKRGDLRISLRGRTTWQPGQLAERVRETFGVGLRIKGRS
jgi:exopolyphosphatase/guanosine-5'-triphosphate,3'-diphosphate pyrophosphatase